MEKDRLMQILANWSKWMRQDTHKLGYPSKSSFLSTGGESSYDTFDIMISDMDMDHVLTIDALIDSLPQRQKKAIYTRFLGENKSLDYYFQLEAAFENLLKMASDRIYA